VAVLAERIALAEDVDADAAVLAALLHDTGHGAADRAGVDDHELRSAGIATDLLRGRVPPARLDAVLDAIAGRRFHKLGRDRAPVGAVLDDADNLDALGHAGVARAFLWLGEHGRRAGADLDPVALAGRDAAALRRHWAEKLSRLPAAMRTETGRALADRRAAQLAAFLRGLEDELAGLAGAPAAVRGRPAPGPRLS
jgi:uncharacterized protein